MPGGFLLLSFGFFMQSASLVLIRLHTDSCKRPLLGETKAAVTLLTQFWFGNVT